MSTNFDAFIWVTLLSIGLLLFPPFSLERLERALTHLIAVFGGMLAGIVLYVFLGAYFASLVTDDKIPLVVAAIFISFALSLLATGACYFYVYRPDKCVNSKGNNQDANAVISKTISCWIGTIVSRRKNAKDVISLCVELIGFSGLLGTLFFDGKLPVKCPNDGILAQIIGCANYNGTNSYIPLLVGSLTLVFVKVVVHLSDGFRCIPWVISAWIRSGIGDVNIKFKRRICIIVSIITFDAILFGLLKCDIDYALWFLILSLALPEFSILFLLHRKRDKYRPLIMEFFKPTELQIQAISSVLSGNRNPQEVLIEHCNGDPHQLKRLIILYSAIIESNELDRLQSGLARAS